MKNIFEKMKWMIHNSFIYHAPHTRILIDSLHSLDDGLKLAEARNSESPERAASVFAFLSVCLLTSYRSQFSTQQPNFLKICSLGLWEKRFFPVFRNFDFWSFEGRFSAIFEYFLLYPL